MKMIVFLQRNRTALLEQEVSTEPSDMTDGDQIFLQIHLILYGIMLHKRILCHILDQNEELHNLYASPRIIKVI
jgi:hypothetical protein